jgi:exopolyphosphatase/guanosine-5'-triphosphate,3'-diphosphate pyrophosphatase
VSPAAFPENAHALASDPTREATTVAAVDLGSNSFHMVIARFFGDDLTILDRLREPVRLADGLDASNRLSSEAQERAIACLERFGQRIRGLPHGCVRVVGTNTLRVARGDRDFRARVRGALGHPIEVISGQEEARLIYQGISHTLPAARDRLLAVDIGGGSTEVMLGRGFDLERAHSLFMGCVSFGRYFPGGKLDRASFREAETAAGLELRTIAGPLREAGCRAAVGSSGTVEAVTELLRLNGLGEPPITLPTLKKLRKLVIQSARVEDLNLPGLKPERRPVLPGGLAILVAIFKSLDIETMALSPGALREGVLYDLIGRIRHHDVRDRAIRRFVDRFRVDVAQAERVEKTALRLLEQAGAPEGLEADSARSLLSWASWLHEIGLVVSYPGYHKHGAYLVANSDLPGFSRDDQILLAALVRAHRRKLREEVFAEIPPPRLDAARKLCVLLRLAVLFHRGRGGRRSIEPTLEWRDRSVRLLFPAEWSAKHPLTRADLDQEARFLADAGITLSRVEARKGAPRGR